MAEPARKREARMESFIVAGLEESGIDLIDLGEA
jgi:hypothetical protein